MSLDRKRGRTEAMHATFRSSYPINLPQPTFSDFTPALTRLDIKLWKERPFQEHARYLFGFEKTRSLQAFIAASV
ncbi:hypothetical protein M378DRAFT_162845, partial [Amanita muscaria Koide BX008]